MYPLPLWAVEGVKTSSGAKQEVGCKRRRRKRKRKRRRRRRGPSPIAIQSRRSQAALLPRPRTALATAEQLSSFLPLVFSGKLRINAGKKVERKYKTYSDQKSLKWIDPFHIEFPFLKKGSKSFKALFVFISKRRI